SIDVRIAGPTLRVHADAVLDDETRLRRQLGIRDGADASDQDIASVVALLGANAQPAARRLDPLDLDPELEADAVAFVKTAEKTADDRRQSAAHEPRRQLQHGDVSTELRRRSRDLETDEAAADEKDRAARLELGSDALRVVEAAEIVD